MSDEKPKPIEVITIDQLKAKLDAGEYGDIKEKLETTHIVNEDGSQSNVYDNIFKEPTNDIERNSKENRKVAIYKEADTGKFVAKRNAVCEEGCSNRLRRSTIACVKGGDCKCDNKFRCKGCKSGSCNSADWKKNAPKTIPPNPPYITEGTYEPYKAKGKDVAVPKRCEAHHIIPKGDMHDFANFGLTEDEGRKLDILQKKLIILRDGEKVRIDGEIQDAKNKFTKSEKAHKEKINKIEAQQGVTKKKINEERVAANKEYRAKKHKKNKEDKIRELKVRKKSLSNGTDSCQNNVCLPYNYHQNGIHRLGTESNKQYINTLYERLKNADTAKKIKGKLNDIRQEMYTGRFKVNDIRIIPGPQQL